VATTVVLPVAGSSRRIVTMKEFASRVATKSLPQASSARPVGKSSPKSNAARSVTCPVR
jgi:hypothetical protein